MTAPLYRYEDRHGNELKDNTLVKVGDETGHVKYICDPDADMEDGAYYAIGPYIHIEWDDGTSERFSFETIGDAYNGIEKYVCDEFDVVT